MRQTILAATLLLFTQLLTTPASAEEQHVNIQISGMTCGTCPITIKHRALQLKGVHTAVVNLKTSSATITYENTQQSAQHIAQAITNLGYPATIKGE